MELIIIDNSEFECTEMQKVRRFNKKQGVSIKKRRTGRVPIKSKECQ